MWRPLLSLAAQKSAPRLLAPKFLGGRIPATNLTITFAIVFEGMLSLLYKNSAQQDVLLSMGRTRKLLEEDAEALDTWTAQYLAENQCESGLRFTGNLPSAVIRRSLYLWLRTSGSSGIINAEAMDGLVDAISRNRSASYSLGPNQRICFHSNLTWSALNLTKYQIIDGLQQCCPLEPHFFCPMVVP